MLKTPHLTYLFLLCTIGLFGCGGQEVKPHTHKKGLHKHHGHHKRFVEPEKLAKRWNIAARDGWQKPDELIKLMSITPGASVADLGTGTGYLLPHLSKAVGPKGKVFAQDIEPTMLAYINKRIQKEQWTNVSTVKGEMKHSGLQPASMDRIVTINVWHHISDRVAYAQHLKTTLKPGGVLYIVDFLAEATEGGGPPLKMRLSQKMVMDDLIKAGFKAKTLTETMPRHYVIQATLQSTSATSQPAQTTTTP